MIPKTYEIVVEQKGIKYLATTRRRIPAQHQRADDTFEVLGVALNGDEMTAIRESVAEAFPPPTLIPIHPTTTWRD